MSLTFLVRVAPRATLFLTTYPLSQTIAPSGFDLRCHPLRVQALLKRKKETGKLLPSQAHGGKPSLLFGHEQQIEEMVAQYPDYTRFRIL